MKKSPSIITISELSSDEPSDHDDQIDPKDPYDLKQQTKNKFGRTEFPRTCPTEQDA